jgi:hypothetical protein
MPRSTVDYAGGPHLRCLRGRLGYSRLVGGAQEGKACAPGGLREIARELGVRYVLEPACGAPANTRAGSHLLAREG